MLLILAVCPAWVGRYVTAAYDMRVFNDGPDYAAFFSLMRSLNLCFQCDPQ